MVASGNNCATLLGLVGEFLELQSKRAEAYACLNEGFRDFLASKVEAPFACIMSQVTSTFKDCSEQVNKIEKVSWDSIHWTFDISGNCVRSNLCP